MIFRKAAVILALILTIQFISGCTQPPDAANNTTINADPHPANANTNIEPAMEGARDNSEELATHVKFPYQPEDLAWKVFNTPSGKRPLAVFQLTDEDSGKLVDSASKVRPPASAIVQPENWFPKELTTRNEITGESGVPATSYAADDFLHPPYTRGTLARIENTDFFVLEVFER